MQSTYAGGFQYRNASIEIRETLREHASVERVVATAVQARGETGVIPAECARRGPPDRRLRPGARAPGGGGAGGVRPPAHGAGGGGVPAAPPRGGNPRGRP